MSKVAILHPGVYDNLENNALTSSFLLDVAVVQYVDGMTKDDLLAAIMVPIPVLSELTHLSFIYHYPGHSQLPFFPDTPSISRMPPTYRYFSDTVVGILDDFHSAAPGLTVDILSCDLNEAAYAAEVQAIEAAIGINIRYGVDKLGNPSSGANWILESETPGVSVLPIYFTNDVLAWNRVLTSDITADIKAGVYSDYIKWKASTKTFTVMKDFAWTELGLSDPYSYITVGNGETFDGANKVIDITGLTWRGLLASSATAFATAPLIKNLGVTGGVFDYNGGAIVRSSQLFFKIENCYSTGNNPNSGGCVVGAYSGYNTGSCTITNCYSTGNTIGTQAGGITGFYSGSFSGQCIITGCYSIGDITGNFAGGIAGDSCGSSSGTCTITNCYSIGNISGDYAGGIAGSYASVNSGSCIITNCYSTGVISGLNSGGIAGSNAGYNSGTCTITNCVCNGTPITGAGSTATVTGSSSTLNDINGSLYGWSNSVWMVGGSVAGLALPILKVFTVSPWDFTTYTKADDEAHFLYLPPPPPDNSFPLRVNPYLSIGDIYVYTTEFVRALVAGTVLPDPGLTPWSTNPVPKGALLRPLGRSAVVNGANKLAIYRFENVQLINGPNSEGVPINSVDGQWYTGWICTWSADGVAPVFP
jgi:hypothetical protein